MSSIDIDNSLINSFKVKDNQNLNDFALQPIVPGSLVIRNGVTYIIGAVSSGKSTLLSKLMALYAKTIDPIIVSFYGGLSQDETTQYNISQFGIKPYFVRLTTPEAMLSFFNQFRYKRTKLSELLMLLLSIYKDNAKLLMESVTYITALNIKDKSVHDNNKRMIALLSYITELMANGTILQSEAQGYVYSSEFINKDYSKRKKLSFKSDAPLFVARVLLSFANGFKNKTITVDVLNEPTLKPNLKNRDALLNRFQPITFRPFLRYIKKLGKIELVPSVCAFDDVAQFPLLTTDHACQFVKDLFAETRRYQNTFIICAQRYNLLNKTLRSLTHTFYIGFGLIDDDLPRIAKEMPSSLMSSQDFLLLYKKSVGPFTFIVYNCKYGVNILKLKK